MSTKRPPHSAACKRQTVLEGIRRNGPVGCRNILGGIVHGYYRDAA
jgi:hypothetical protein